MEQFIGLDVSLKDTFISVRENGERIWRGKCPSDPKLIAEVIRKRAANAKRVVFETGPLSVWFYHALKLEGLPAICIDARHAKAALDMAPNKTDANDADGLAHLAEVGFYREVRVKSFDSMLVRTLVAARNQLLKATTQLSNQIRGLMKTFGLVVPKSVGRVFESHVQSLLASNAGLEQIILPVLDAWRGMRARAAELSKQLVASSRASEQCQLLSSIPGVGAVTASSFVAAIEDPENFSKSRSVGAWIGLTTRRYQSGEVDYDGHISRRGDNHLRGLLYEAAVVILTRTTADSALRIWGLKLKEKVGFKRAAVAVARKLAVIMHTMCAQANTTGVHRPWVRMSSTGRHTRRPLPFRQHSRFLSHQRPSPKWNTLCPCGRAQCSHRPFALTKRTSCDSCGQSIGYKNKCSGRIGIRLPIPAPKR